MKKVKILIVDDHSLVRQSWKVLINMHPMFEVIGETDSGEEAVNLVKDLKPDVVTMDINLTGITGIEATELIKKSSPGTKILGVSMHKQPNYARKMMQMGAMGYVTKNSDPEELYCAITEIWEGRRYICNEVKDLISEQIINPQSENKSNKINLLSMRELEVIKLIKKGMTSKEIADNLFISSRTAEAHRYNILKKLKINNSAALMEFIYQNEVSLGF